MTAFKDQVGGDHYRNMAIQPAQYILTNRLGWAEGCAISYISRWREKGGVEDLRKAIHTLELLIAAEASAPSASTASAAFRCAVDSDDPPEPELGGYGG